MVTYQLSCLQMTNENHLYVLLYIGHWLEADQSGSAGHVIIECL